MTDLLCSAVALGAEVVDDKLRAAQVPAHREDAPSRLGRTLHLHAVGEWTAFTEVDGAVGVRTAVLAIGLKATNALGKRTDRVSAH
jgi:hypothetical protein